MKTATPLLVSVSEAAFQLSLPANEVVALVREGDLTAVMVRNQVLIVYESMTAFTRRAKRHNTILEVSPIGA